MKMNNNQRALTELEKEMKIVSKQEMKQCNKIIRIYILSLVFFSLISYNVFSQTTEKINENQIEYTLCSSSTSVFKDVCHSTSMDVSVNGLFFIDSKGKNITKKINSFNNKFTIVPDKENVYDCSFKKYSVQIDKKSSFNYRYYFRSNEISYNFEGEDYIFSTIDGSCDTCIKGLKISYVKKNKGEVMVIEFETNIDLVSKKGNLLTIKKGSYCVFAI